VLYRLPSFELVRQLAASLITLARGASDELWRTGSIAPDRFVKSKSFGSFEARFFCDPSALAVQGSIVPWELAEEIYHADLCKDSGQPIVLARVALGALLIKVRLGLTDQFLPGASPLDENSGI